MKLFFFAVLCFLLLSCSNSEEKAEMTTAKKNSFSYVYSYDSNLNIDTTTSFFFCLNESYEESLNLYAFLDSFYCTTSNAHVFIFKLHNDKFAIVIDSTTKIYKFNLLIFEKFLNIPQGFDYFRSKLKIDTIDINADGYDDITLQFFNNFICLFYNPDEKIFVYDRNSDLRTVELDLKNKEVKTYYKWGIHAFFSIEKYSFKIKEKVIPLQIINIDHVLESGCENLIVHEKYDTSGNIQTIDTVRVNCR